MTFLSSLAVLSVLALVGFNAWTYYHATGSIADRLAASGKGTLTIFVGIWGTIATVATDGCDLLANLTGDPMFAQWADAVKSVIPAQYHPIIPLLALSATMAARLRTLPKS
jgi:hypothetical protein